MGPLHNYYTFHIFSFCLLNWFHLTSAIGFKPTQTHISTGSFDQMTIVWSTELNTSESVVYYGPNKNLSLITSGSSRKFIDGGSAHRMQYIHKVILKGLKPEIRYYYSVGSRIEKSLSDVFTFKTWPEGDKWSPNLAIYGDLGFVNSQSLPRLEVDALQEMYHSILHVGDFAYDMDNYDGLLGDEFMQMIEPLAATVPYMTCPGNHEQAYNFSEYKNRFEMPGDIDKRMYYSFTMGPVRFISVATELIFFPQYGFVPIIVHYNWLKEQLKEANLPENRAKQPWVITFGHRPMYCSNNDKDDCTHNESVLRVGVPILKIFGWEELYNQYGVDLAIWAHEHSYERLWPVYNRQVKNGSYGHPYTNPGATVHVITGSAGCQENHDGFIKPPEAWSAFRSDDYGYTRMKIFNASHLYMEQVSDDKLLQNGSVPHQPNTSDDEVRLEGQHFPDTIPPTYKNQHPTRICIVCSKKGIKRKETRNYCPECPSKSALCYPQCYKYYHTRFIYWQ